MRHILDMSSLPVFILQVRCVQILTQPPFITIKYLSQHPIKPRRSWWLRLLDPRTSLESLAENSFAPGLRFPSWKFRLYMQEYSVYRSPHRPPQVCSEFNGVENIRTTKSELVCKADCIFCKTKWTQLASFHTLTQPGRLPESLNRV